MFARYAQSLFSSYSAVKLVGLCLNHPYYEPSYTAEGSYERQLPALPPHHTLVYYLSKRAFVYALVAWLLLLIIL